MSSENQGPGVQRYAPPQPALAAAAAMEEGQYRAAPPQHSSYHHQQQHHPNPAAQRGDWRGEYDYEYGRRSYPPPPHGGYNGPPQEPGREPSAQIRYNNGYSSPTLQEYDSRAYERPTQATPAERNNANDYPRRVLFTSSTKAGSTSPRPPHSSNRDEYSQHYSRYENHSSSYSENGRDGLAAAPYASPPPKQSYPPQRSPFGDVTNTSPEGSDDECKNQGQYDQPPYPNPATTNNDENEPPASSYYYKDPTSANKNSPPRSAPHRSPLLKTPTAASAAPPPHQLRYYASPPSEGTRLYSREYPPSALPVMSHYHERNEHWVTPRRALEDRQYYAEENDDYYRQSPYYHQQQHASSSYHTSRYVQYDEAGGAENIDQGAYPILSTPRKQLWDTSPDNTSPPSSANAALGPPKPKKRKTTNPTASSSATKQRRKKMYSDYVGVTYNKTHAKYQACITHYRKQHYLGRYKLAVDAARAYDESAKLLKGSGWKINFGSEEEYERAKKKEIEGMEEKKKQLLLKEQGDEDKENRKQEDEDNREQVKEKVDTEKKSEDNSNSKKEVQEDKVKKEDDQDTEKEEDTKKKEEDEILPSKKQKLSTSQKEQPQEKEEQQEKAQRPKASATTTSTAVTPSPQAPKAASQKEKRRHLYQQQQHVQESSLSSHPMNDYRRRNIPVSPPRQYSYAPQYHNREEQHYRYEHPHYPQDHQQEEYYHSYYHYDDARRAEAERRLYYEQPHHQQHRYSDQHHFDARAVVSREHSSSDVSETEPKPQHYYDNQRVGNDQYHPRQHYPVQRKQYSRQDEGSIDSREPKDDASDSVVPSGSNSKNEITTSGTSQAPSQTTKELEERQKQQGKPKTSIVSPSRKERVQTTSQSSSRQAPNATPVMQNGTLAAASALMTLVGGN